MATLGGLGRLSRAPGTVASVLPFGAMALVGEVAVPWHLGLLALLTAVAVVAGGQVARASGRQDDPAIVIDEVAGGWAVLTGVPPEVSYLIVGFLLFRALDILKVVPLRSIQDHVTGGWGVVLDDLVAGVMANLALQAVRWGFE